MYPILDWIGDKPAENSNPGKRTEEGGGEDEKEKKRGKRKRKAKKGE